MSEAVFRWLLRLPLLTVLAVVLVYAALAVTARAAEDLTICSAADQAGCTVPNAVNNTTEEVRGLSRRTPYIATGVTGSNAIAACATPAPPALTDGLKVEIKPVATSSGAVTFNFCSFGAKPLVSSVGVALGSGDNLSSTIYTYRYFAANDQWRQSVGGGGSGGGGGASTSAPFVTIGNSAGLSNERALTPDGTTITGTDGGGDGAYTLSVAANGIGNGQLRQGVGVSVVGRGANSTGNLADIVAAADNDVLRRAGGAVGFGTLDAASVGAGVLADARVNGALEADELTMAGDLSGLANNAQLVADSVTAAEIAAGAVGTSEAANLDASDVSTGTFTDAQINGALEADEVNPVLGSQTDGNFQLSTAAGPGIAVTGADAEGATKTVALDFSAPGADPALAADQGRFSPSGLVFEGSAADTFESRVTITNPTADVAFTIPNANSNPVRPLTCGGTDKVSAIAADGTLTCSADAGGAGAGTPVSVNGAASVAADLDNATPAAPASGFNVKWQRQAGSPDDISAFVDYGAGLGVAGGKLVADPSSEIMGKVVASTATGTLNDFAPTGWNDAEPNRAAIIEWNGTSPALLTGLTGGSAARAILLRNRSAEQVVVIQHEASTSTAANRFVAESASPRAHIILLPGDTLQFVYDAVASRWKPVDIDYDISSRLGWLRTAQVAGTGTAPISLGIAHTSASAGTISTPVIASGSYRNQMRRTQCVTGTTAGVSCGTRHALQTVWRGNAAGLGGFLAHYTWGFNAVDVAQMTWFAGLFNSTAAPANQNMSANLHMIGWGTDPADTAQVRAIGNDGTGSGTKIDLGAGFPVNTTAVFEGWLFATPNGTGITQILWRKDDMTVAPDVRFNSAAADLPGNTNLLSHYIYIGNRAAAVSYGIDWGLVEELRPY